MRYFEYDNRSGEGVSFSIHWQGNQKVIVVPPFTRFVLTEEDDKAYTYITEQGLVTKLDESRVMPFSDYCEMQR